MINMRRLPLIVFCAMSFLTDSRSDAQNSRIGATAGYNISNFSGMKGMSSRPGVVVGGFVQYNFVGGFSIQPELLFSMEGASGFPPLTAYPVGAGPDNLIFNYVEVPILWKYNIFTSPVLPLILDLYAGPDFAFNVASRDKSSIMGNGFDSNNSSLTHPFDFDIAVGGGPTLNLVNVSLGVEVKLGTHLVLGRFIRVPLRTATPETASGRLWRASDTNYHMEFSFSSGARLIQLI